MQYTAQNKSGLWRVHPGGCMTTYPPYLIVIPMSLDSVVIESNGGILTPVLLDLGYFLVLLALCIQIECCARSVCVTIEGCKEGR